MNNTFNIHKKGKLILHIAKLTLLVLAFLLLVIISFSATETQELYATSGGQRYSVDTDYNYFSTNFFGRMSYLSSEGFAPILEIVFLVVLVINIVVAAVAMIPRCEILNKIYFSVLPLAAVVLCIVVMIDGDCDYVLDIEGPVYLEGLKVYLEKDVSFNMILVPSLIGCILAFVISLVPGVLSLLKSKGAKIQNDGVTSSIAPQVADKQTPQASTFIGSVPDELKKYKDLLDLGAITQEEFDIKKKELLGI